MAANAALVISGEGPRRGPNVRAIPMNVVTESHIGNMAAARLWLSRMRSVRNGDKATSS